MNESEIPNTANRQIARAAGTIMLAFALSNIIGLVRQILISRAFGTDKAIDAFYAASTYPDLIFSLVAGGALASAFIPTFTTLLAKNERASAWKLASSIANLILIILSALSILSAVLAPQIIRYILAPQFSPDQQALAASLLRILLLTPAIFGISGLLMGILNAHQRFLLPALAPSMYWLGMIFGLIFLVPSMGVYGLAWGAALGAAFHLGVQIPDLIKILPHPIPSPNGRRAGDEGLGINNPSVREVGRLMGPRLLGVAVVQLNFVVNVIIASGLSEGSLSAIKYAWQVMTMPQVVIAQAIAIAALPTFSAQAAQGETGQMRSSLAATLRGVLFLSLPASLGIILLRQPLISLLFQRGSFDARSTDLVAWALLWYAAGLIGHNMVEILSRAFYALHDTKTPVFVGAAAMTLNVLFSFGFSALFSRLGWLPHGGLALANSFATALEMTALFILMRRRLKGLDGMNIWRGFIQAALGTLAMSLVIIFWSQIESSVWISGLGGVALGGLVYAAMMFALRVPELAAVINGIARRLKRAG
ncbi:MAG: murein biosynthesis integral membrane protein MurJ [Chloroflexi bacterium]|nr:murein biosynthesis integral membrane protein MurJ [Chloroflexota bacterium]MBI3340469.1 murein biosynthesis integral membrane protein MurJ [Chloroflexota bacterium]